MKAVFAVTTLLALVCLSCANQCQWGPSFWCLNKENAARCGQVQYCHDNIWALQNKVQEPDLDTCDICKLLVTMVDKYLEENRTEDEAKAAVEELCSFLGEFESSCDALVDQYFEEIWNLLLDETDPDKVCTEIGLCTSIIAKEVKPVVAEGDEFCDVCRAVAAFLKPFVDSNVTKKEVREALEGFCSLLKSVTDECDDLIEKYFNVIWRVLKKEFDSGMLCEGLCTQDSVAIVTKPLVSEPDSVSCEVCEIVVGYIEGYFLDNRTEAEAKDLIEKACSVLGPFESECKELVDKYFDEIWKMLEEELTPDLICKELGLCSSLIMESEPDSVSCEVCVLVVGYIEGYLLDNKTEAEAKDLIEKACSVLGPFESECKELVDKYFDEIWKMLEEELTPDLICKELGLCSSLIMESEPDSVSCEVCTMVVMMIKELVDNNKTEEEVEKYMEEACSILGKFEAECKELIDTYFDRIWKMLIDELTPSEICAQLKLCSSMRSSIKLKDEECDICKTVTEFLQIYFDNNATEEEVKALLEEICDYLPVFKDQCNELLDRFDEYWEFIQKEVDGEAVCYQFGICTSLPSSTVAMEKKSVAKGILCDICDLVVKFIRPFVDANNTKDEVKGLLEKMCSLLPSEYKEKCDGFIVEYFDLIWGIMKQEVDDNELCVLIGVCNQTSVAVPTNVIVTTHVEDPEFILCELCQFILEKIESLLVNNATESEIIALVEKICSLLPDELREDCDEFIQKYGEEIIKLLVSKVAAKEICVILGVCVAEKHGFPVMAGRSIKFSPHHEEIDKCSVCEFAIELVKDILQQNLTEKAIEDALEKVCELFPSALRDECTDFVKEFEKQLIELIIKGIDSQKICEDLGVCTKTTGSLAEPWNMIKKAFLPK